MTLTRTVDHFLTVAAGHASDAQRATRLCAEYVRLARENGATWAQVGRALGVSRQAAHQRFARSHEQTEERA